MRMPFDRPERTRRRHARAAATRTNPPTAPRALALAFGLALALALAATGCGKETTRPPGPPPAAYLLVVNSLGETFDRIDLDTGQVTQGVAATGNAPNDLWVDAARGRAWVANSMDNAVTAYDLATLAPVAAVALGPNSNPWNLAPAPNGRLLVTNWLAGDVAEIDAAAGALLQRIPVGRTPEGILAGSSATFLRVTLVNYDEATHRFGPGQVFTYCPVCQREPAPLVTVGTNPQTLLTGPDGRIHVVCTGNFGGYEPAEWGQVRVLDWPTLGQQDTLRLGGTPDRAQVVGDMVYVSAFFGGLMKYDGRTHAVLRDSTRPILDAPGLGAMAYDAGRKRLYVAGFDDDTIYVVDTTADTLVTAWPVGDGPVALARVEAAAPGR